MARIVAELVPNEAEVHGLVALMEIQASRIGARTLPDGTPIPLFEQNRARWPPAVPPRSTRSTSGRAGGR